MTDIASGLRGLRTLAVAAWALVLVPQTGTAQAMQAPDFLVTRPSAYGFDETISLLKQAIEAENLMVVHEINPQQMMRMVGVRTGGMRQILFFHPRYMKRILEANRAGGIEAPMKILAMERPDGRVMVRFHDPVHQFAPYDGLEEVAGELKAVIERVVAAVTQ
jgi:uncharacterized protein (DUF302 family)